MHSVTEKKSISLLKVRPVNEEEDVVSKPSRCEWKPMHEVAKTDRIVKKLLVHGVLNGIYIENPASIRRLDWHSNGSYLAVTSTHTTSPSEQCIIHNIITQKSLQPFKKLGAGRMQTAIFHPTEPWLVVGYHKGVKIYNLKKSSNESTSGSVKRFIGAESINCLDIHPSGVHIVAGCANKRCMWYDSELGSQPYKVLRYPDSSIVDIGFHKTLPLLFSAGSNGGISILHTRVYDDYITNPLIVP